MDELKRIASFEKNHDVLEKGLYKCGEAHGVTTWDLRFKKPNGGDYVSPKAAHTVEHLLATVLRNSARRDDIIYFGPMGCRTGFYLLTCGMEFEEIKALLAESLQKACELDSVPGSRREECGNYLEHDLADAKRECSEYLKVLRGEK